MNKEIKLEVYDSGFPKADSNYNSLSIVDDYVYYTLCTHDIDIPARAYRVKIGSNTPELIGDLTEICGEAGVKRIPQGKSHTPFFKYDNKVWFATHCSFYGGTTEGGKENPAPPPEGYLDYSGGRIICINEDGSKKVVAKSPDGEGIITMTMDTDRGICFCLTWPSALLLIYDVNADKLVNAGKVALDGEIGAGDRYSCICRIFAVEPTTGIAYFTLSNGEVYSTDKDGNVELVDWCNLKRDMFGEFDPTRGGHQGYNWRYLVYNKTYKKFYGVMPKSGYLFSFDPVNKEFKLIDRIAAKVCRESGSFEDFRYGYMTLTKAPNNDDMLYYVSGYTHKDGTPRLTAVTYSLSKNEYKDHGDIVLPNGEYPKNIQTLGVDDNGVWYCCPWIKTDKLDKKGEVFYTSDLAKFTV